MYEYRAKLIRILDGDTIDAEIDLGFNVWIKERIRMYGINTPESRTKDAEEKIKGLAAKARLNELLEQYAEDGFILRSHLGDKKGKFGRILGEIIIKEVSGEINLNQTLIEEGHAVPYFGGKR